MNKAFGVCLKGYDKQMNDLNTAVPNALVGLKKNRKLLSHFIHMKRGYDKPLVNMEEGARAILNRDLQTMSKTLVGAYHMTVELLRKRNMLLQCAQALHELGNLSWLDADKRGAGMRWSEGVD